MGATLEITGYDELLKMLDRIDTALTGKIKREMVKAAGAVVAKRARDLVPVGDPADKPDLKALRDTIAIEVRDYGLRSLAVVGPALPAGAHAHNVEYGHRIVVGRRARGRKLRRTEDTRRDTASRARPRPFMRPAFDETQEAQLGAMAAMVQATLRELGV